MRAHTKPVEQLAEEIDAHVAALPENQRFKHLPDLIEESEFWSYAVTNPYIREWITCLRNKKLRRLLSCWPASRCPVDRLSQLLTIVLTQRCRKEVYELWTVLTRQSTRRLWIDVLQTSIDDLDFKLQVRRGRTLAIWLFDMGSKPFSSRCYDIFGDLSLEDLETFHPPLEALRKYADNLRKKLVRGPQYIQECANIRSITHTLGEPIDSKGRALLREALEQLDVQTRYLIRLRWVERLTVIEMAHETRRTERDVKKIIAAGVAFIRTWMEKKGYRRGS